MALQNRAKAYHNYWNSFGWAAYDENTVPEGSLAANDSKQITYSFGTPSDFQHGMMLTVSLWHRSTSWAAITDKADAIYEVIGYAGNIIKTSEGYIWIKRGQPFAQRMSDTDDALRRIVINVEVDFLNE